MYRSRYRLSCHAWTPVGAENTSDVADLSCSPTVYPEPGWHEHDPSVYMTSIDKCIKEVLKEFASLGYEKEMLKGVGIATQRETTLVWDKNTGRPLCNASESPSGF